MVNQMSSASRTDLGDESPGYIGGCGEPHPAMAFALPYLKIEDLLLVEMVCKSLRDEVRSNNNLLWRNITVDRYPLNDKIGDKSLVNLARKSQGFMESLKLDNCPWITNDSLKIVLSNNPNLTKLCVTHCRKITLDDILDNLRTIKLGIKLLRVNGLRYNSPHTVDAIAKLEELHLLVSPEIHNRNKSFCPSQGRPIDIEKCVSCGKATTVYEILRRGIKEEDLSPPCGLCGDCTACQRVGLVCYPCACDECYRKGGGRYLTDPSPKIVSSACFVVTDQVPRGAVQVASS